MHLALLLSLSAARLSLSLSTASSFACDAGCDAKPSLECGVDGLTYLNDCVASCQGVEVAALGACEGSKLLDHLVGKEASELASAPIGKDVLHKYASDGFTFIGFAQMASDDAKPTLPSLLMPSEAEKRALESADPPLLIRISEGRLYVQAKHKRAELGAGNAEGHEAYVPAEDDGFARRLTVFGKDERRIVYNTTNFPYKAVGLVLIYNKAGKNIGWCTGALVSPHAVLTAGQCLRQNGKFFSDWSFVPGYVPRKTLKESAPFGVFGVSSATTFGNSNDTYDPAYDMGVLTLVRPAGKRLGHVGVTVACLQGETLSTTGFPYDVQRSASDKRTPHMTTEQCTNFLNNCKWRGSFWYNIVRTDCDLAFGQTGAPVYSAATKRVSGVFAATFYFTKSYKEHLPRSSYPKKAFNAITAITKEKYAAFSPLFV